MLQALLMEGETRRPISWPAERDQWLEGNGLLWLDLEGPSAAELEELAAILGLHPSIVRACLHPEHRARLREFGHHLLLVLNAVGKGVPDSKQHTELGRWRTLELNVVVGERFVLTVHPEHLPAVGTLYQRYCHEGEGRPGAEYLLYGICESVTTGYSVLLDRMDRYIDEAEDLIFHGNVTRKVVDRLFSLKRHILYLRRVLGPQRDAMGALMRRDFATIAQESRPFFLDVYEHNLWLLELLDTYRDLITSSLDAYLSMVSNRTNDVMKVLTIVSTIMLPLTVITGIFGMNFVAIPLENDPWGFWLTMAGMGVISLAMLFYFKRRRWL